MKKIFTFILALVTSVGIMMASINGGLTGAFSINASGDLIQFSQGNLQATTTDLGANWTWSFATNQWDYIGNAVANNAINGNGTVSSNGTVDLFGWSTAATYYGINNSTDNDDYSGDFVDWSSNPIANGGNKANAWRTLDMDEWAYLFFGRTDAAQLFSLGKVNGVNGIILLPDNWSGDKYDNAADGLTNQGTYYENASGTNFNFHTYDGDAWNAMAAAGAVFLPAAGYRNGTGVNNAGSEGYFWTASSYDHRPYYLGFSSTYLDPQSYGPRHLGHAVRLVQDVKIPAVGDTIRYEYKDNTLYYKILSKNATNQTVGLVNDGTSEIEWTEANKPTGALVIPDSIEDWQGTKYAVTDLYARAFQGCTNITSIDFSENTHIQTIGFCGFLGCTKVASITLSDYIKTIDGYAFQGLVNVHSIDLKNVERINQNAFNGCTISTVNLPKTLAILEANTYLFYNANTITIDAENPNFVVIDNVLYNKDVTKLFAFPGNFQDDDEIHIPATVTAALSGSLRNCYATVYIQSKITFDEHNWSNSPMKDVVVACGLYDYYTTGYYEGVGSGSTGDFQYVDNLSEHLFWTIQATADANGSVALTDTANCNEVHITATPDAGYSFWKWSNDATTAEITLEVESDTAVTAFFHPLIGNVALTVTFPDKGAEILSHYHIYTPADLGWSDLCPDGANYHCVRILFYNGSGNYYDETALKPNTTYRALFWIAPNDGYDFPRSGEYVNINNITTTVNGQNRADYTWSNDYCIFGINFTTSIATGVENVQKADGCTQKLLRNGQLYILRNGEMYNAQGARVE